MTKPVAESQHPVRPQSAAAVRQLKRLRRVCAAMPGCEERVSHGEPTWFGGQGARKKVFAMFDNNHHKTGHIAVWIPAEPGLQEVLMAEAPEVYFRPPYVGGCGWVGIELAKVSDEALQAHIQQAWRMSMAKKVMTLER